MTPRSPGSGLGCGWRAAPKFSKGLGAQLELCSVGAGTEPVAAGWGRLGVALPPRGFGKRHPRVAHAGAPVPRPAHLARSGRGPVEP